MDDKKVIDLALFLSPETCKVLSVAALNAKKLKHEVIDVEHIVLSILTTDQNTQTILRNSAQYSSILSSIESKLDRKEKWNKRPELIPMSEDVKIALIDTLFESVLLKEQYISPLSLFMALSKTDKSGIDYDSLLKILSLTRGIQISNSSNSDTPEGIEDITSEPPDVISKYIDRSEYTDQIIRSLYKDNKKNILLVGNDGVGRTSFSYVLAKRSYEQEGIFSGSKVYLYDAQKISLANFPQILTSLKTISDKETNQSIKFILFLSNLEITQNENKDYGAITSIFDGILSSKLWGIIPIDYTQYQIIIKSYPSIIKNSEVVFIEEPETDVSFQMIQVKYKDNPEFQISDETIHDAITLARRFIHDKFLPESAISLIDEAISQARIDRRTTIDTNNLKAILSQKTGVPLTDITSEEAADLQNLDSLLKGSVIGQDEAVDAVAKTIKRSRTGLKDPKRPIGSFLFIGPSGTGKTQLAKALAKIVYKDENAMIRIDMSEYTDTHTVDRLIGSPPGYVGYEEGGQLTNKVLKKPYSLILLDEVEKANPKVFDIFLQVLDDGRLTDGQGKTVDFKNTIIIMTSNLVDVDNLNKFFRPEFLNRIDQTIYFKPLSIETGKVITGLFIKDLQERLLEKKVTLEVADNVIEQIANEGISDKFGARPLKRLVEEKIEDPIVEQIISGQITSGQTVKWTQIT